MSTIYRNDELGRLVGAMCDGTITADETGRLDSLLATRRRGAAVLQQLHVSACRVVFAACVGGSRGEREGFGIADIGRELERAGSSSTPTEDEKQPAVRILPLSRKRRAWLAIAAALIGVAAVSSLLTYSLTSGGKKAVEVAQGATYKDATDVARITATRNCLWAEAEKNLGFGSRLTSGQRLDLTTGLVEITFNDGAVVVLEGPATFDVQSPGKAQLDEGRLAAVVPERAHGFEVTTARLNVVDLGTEFGLMAEPEGTTEVHVFNGLVKAQLLDEHGHQVRTMELNTAQAARIEPAAALVARIPARDDEFVRIAFGGGRAARWAVCLRRFQLPGRSARRAKRRVRLGRPLVQRRGR